MLHKANNVCLRSKSVLKYLQNTRNFQGGASQLLIDTPNNH